VHYYQHNIGDYRRDTAHLSLLEHGVYRQLIDWYCLDETPIPNDNPTVMRRLCARTQEDQNAVLSVLKDFFICTPKGYEHKRCNAEIAIYHEKAEKNKANGNKGGRPKKTQSVIFGNPTQTQNNPNQEPLTINHKPINPLTQEPINQEPKVKKQGKVKNTREALFDFPLPGFLNRDKWRLWMETRKGTVMTQNQAQAQVDKLALWQQRGIDANAALANSADAGWQGLFEPKTQITPYALKGKIISDRNDEVLASYLAKDREREIDVTP
jgi:uncharacterized protein YdaU (DUF1376 family)